MALAEDTEAFLKKHNLKDATLIGHSMGAKTVMTMALKDPNCCANIIAVDNAPVDAALASDFPRYVEGMRRVEDAKVTSQKEADGILQPFAKVRDRFLPVNISQYCFEIRSGRLSDS